MAGAIHFAITHSAAGGLRELWDDLAEGLAARGHPVGRFVLYPPHGAEHDAAPAADWHHIVDRKPRSPLAALRTVAALVRYIRRERPAAIVSSMPATNVVLPVAVTLAGTPTRLFLSHHSPADTHHPLLDRLDGWTGRLGCVAGIVSVSDAVAASLRHKPAAYRAKMVTIHNALSARIEAVIDGLPRPDRSGRTGPLRVVAMGRLSHQKNYPMLLRAMAEAPGATLEVLGGGEDEAALRALIAELGIDDRVTLAGLLPRAEALARAAAADVFVQVSRYEGHSLALIEAARLALPIIVSDVPVQIEGVSAADGTRCGMVVPLDDHHALAARINELADDAEARARWGERARRLSREATHARMLDRYEAVLARPAAAG